MAKRLTPSKGSKPDKLCRDALALALNREAADADGKPTKRLNIIADQLVRKAMSGDLIAIREIFDRLDGKIAQATSVAGNGQVILHVHSGIQRSGDDDYPTIEADRHLIEDATELAEDDGSIVVPIRP